LIEAAEEALISLKEGYNDETKQAARVNPKVSTKIHLLTLISIVHPNDL
jgi:hypothetical protein